MSLRPFRESASATFHWGLQLSERVGGRRRAATVARTICHLIPIRRCSPFAWRASTEWEEEWSELGIENRKTRTRWGGPSIASNPQCRGSRFFWYSGFWEPEVSAWVASQASDDGPNILIDVGANFGYFTALWLAVAGEGAVCVAVEPAPKLLPLLHRNFDDRPDSVKIAPYAIGDLEARVRFLNHPAMLGCIVDEANGIEPSDSVEVVCRPLRSLIHEYVGPNPISCVKIDAEGYDTTIVLQSRDVFESGQIKSVVWEIDEDPKKQDDAESLLIDLGYRRTLLTNDYVGFEKADASHC